MWVEDNGTVASILLSPAALDLFRFHKWKRHLGRHGCRRQDDINRDLLLLLSVGPAVPRLMYCSLPRLIVLTPLWFPLSSPEELHIRWRERPLSAKGGTMGEK
jgi:hypothetical protein